MAPSRLNSDKLTDYLSQLSPEVAMFLIREIEHQRADGKDDTVYERVLNSARNVVRTAHLKVERRTSPLRVFCEPFQDFLFDDARSFLQRGRICRPSINAVWSWLTSEHAPRDIAEIAKKFEMEAKRGDLRSAGLLGQQMLEDGAEAIEEAVEATRESTKAKTRLEAVMGGRAAVFDAGEMAAAIRASAAIHELRDALPEFIEDFGPEEIEAVAGPVELCMDRIPHRPEFAFATLIAHLAAPTQALRLAVHRVGTDSAGRLAVSSFAGIGALLFHDLYVLARKVDDLVRDKASAASILYALSRYHGHATGIEQELDIAARSPWGEKLSGARRVASEALDAEIRKIQSLLSLLMKPRANAKPGQPMPWPDPDAVSDAERGFALLAGCRPFLDQLSLHEAVLVTERALKGRLDLIADQILNELRHCAGADKHAARAWLEAVVSLIGIAFSKTDAELLERSGMVASKSVI